MPFKKNFKKAAIVKTAPVRVIKDWSSYQLAIFNDVENGQGNTHIEAVAGSSKTTSLVESSYHIASDTKTLMCAFGKHIQMELESRVKPGIECATMHAIGNRALRKMNPKIKLDEYKLYGYIEAALGKEPETKDTRDCLKKGVDFAKLNLATESEKFDEVIDQYSLDTGDLSREDFITEVLKLVEATKQDTNRMDFVDMIFLPIAHNLKLNKYGMVFIDEVQDLNKCQVELAVNSAENNGRVVSAGDRSQAIFSFASADTKSIDNLVNRLNSKTLPLSVCYRCAKSIVLLAKEIVPQIEYAPGAEEGFIGECDFNQVENMIKPGNFLLSRVNAPLIGMCMRLLKNRIPANIQGRDVGAGLLALIKKSKAKNVDSFLEWVSEWEKLEIDRIIKLRRDPSSVEDRAECLRSLCEGTNELADVKNNIKQLFNDGDDKARVILSSVHRAKGLERDRVFMLESTFKPGKNQEEDNLKYIAITRARKELYLVQGK